MSSAIIYIMTTRERAKQLFSQGIKQVEIARILNISAQRVHQIVKEYKPKNFNTTLGRMWTIQDECPCELCGKRKVELHHRDYNNSNTDISNIQPLCKKCHYMVHTKSYKRDLLKEIVIYHNPYVLRKFF